MSSSEAEPMFLSEIDEGSSIPELISVLRSSFQQKEFDEVLRLLMVRETKLQEERDNLRIDFNSMKKKCDLLAKEHGRSKLNELSIKQELERCKRDQETSRKELSKLKNDYNILEDRLAEAETMYKAVAEDLKKVESEKKMWGDIARELKKKDKKIEKLVEENDLLYGFLKRDGRRIFKLEDDVAEICGVEVMHVREGVSYEEVDVVIERIRRMSCLCDDNEDLHKVTEAGPVANENADFGINKQQEGSESDKSLEKSTVETLSNGYCEIVVPQKSDFLLLSSPVKGFPSTNTTSSDKGQDPVLNVETRSSSDLATSLVPVTNRPLSPIVVVISDSEDENLPSRKRRRVDSDMGAGSYDGGVHYDDDDDSSGSELDVTCFESYMENKLVKLIKYKESAWKSAADMLSAFEKDYEPCMDAVCALYRNKFLSKSSNSNLSVPGDQVLLDFNAMRGEALAEYLIDGDPQKKLKKTVSEVYLKDPKLLSQCRDLAIDFCDALFNLYIQGKDRQFRPDL